MISKSLSGGFYIATFDHPNVSGTLPIQHLGPFGAPWPPIFLGLVPRHITGLPLRRKWLRPSVLDVDRGRHRGFGDANLVVTPLTIQYVLILSFVSHRIPQFFPPKTSNILQFCWLSSDNFTTFAMENWWTLPIWFKDLPILRMLISIAHSYVKLSKGAVGLVLCALQWSNMAGWESP